MGLFTQIVSPEQKNEPYLFAPCPSWSNRETLEKEKEVIGFYLSAHPLDTYRQQISWFTPTPFGEILQAAQQHRGEQEYVALLCGLLKSRKDIVTKKGDRMAFIQLEDGTSTAQVILFPKTFAATEQWLADYHVFLVKGAVDITDPKKLKIKASQAVPIDLILQEWKPIHHATFQLPQQIDEAMLKQLQTILATSGPIPSSCIFHDQGKKLRLAMKRKVALDKEILDKIEHLKIKTLISL